MFFDRDRTVNKAIKDFFKRRTLSRFEEEKNQQHRKNLQPVRLSDPDCKEDLMKIMDRVGATNLLTFCGKIRRYAK